MRNWPFDPLQPLSYDFIMADPPWDFSLRSVKGQTSKAAAGHYSCMSIEDIAALPVGQLGRGDTLLWLWATHPMIDQQIEVLRRWGFTFVTSGVWGKLTAKGRIAFGTGYRLRCASEPFLIGTLGNPESAKNIRTLFMAQVREHSRKPDEAYTIAEAMMPKAVRRADLFARQSRDGWEGWGNEATKFDGATHA